jgi:LPPG:FO 2-phospho-L-lactate transferase
MLEASSRDVVVLAGGVGAARFLEGVVQVVDPSRVTVIVNTGDDAEFYGLTVSPDVDIVLFTLAGIVEPSQGWGVRDDTFNALDMLEKLGRERWFLLGDRDLAVHIHRTELLRQGLTPSEVTDDLRRRLGLEVRVLPMTDQPVRTTIRTPDGWLPFQEYFVKRRQQDDVLEIRYDGAEEAMPAPGLLDAIHAAAVVLISPSNPLVSVGTILALPGVRDALRTTDATIVGVSPIVGGATIKGPADRMMRGLGMEVSAVGVARAYADFLDVLVIDQQDADLAAGVEAEGVRAVVTDTIMRSLDVKGALAQVTLEQAGLR